MAVIETQGFKLDNSGKRIVVDRSRGSRATCASRSTSTNKNVIRNAVSTGTMWRGLGSDPEGAGPA